MGGTMMQRPDLNVTFDFSGKTALVTGGSSGIGKATALLLARAGARVAILGRDEKELESAAREISAGSGTDVRHEVLTLAGDVSDAAVMEDALRSAGEAFGTLDIVVANAGTNGVWAPLDQLTAEEWDTTMNVNLRGTFLTVKHALPYLRKRGGSVIIVSSINGTRVFSNSGATAYSCSKAGQVAFCKMAALELAKDRIRVNTVCPGAISTNIESDMECRNLEDLHLPVEFPEGDVPLTGGGPGKPEQVARLIAFLASDAAEHITGSVVHIEGAQSLLQG